MFVYSYHRKSFCAEIPIREAVARLHVLTDVSIVKLRLFLDVDAAQMGFTVT